MVPGDTSDSNLGSSFSPDHSVEGLEDLPSADAAMNLLVGEEAINAGLKSVPLKEMFAYYLSLRDGDSPLPTRASFSPAALPRHLPNIFLVELEIQDSGEVDYRYRVFGTGLAILFGVEMTGKLVSEFPGVNRAKRSARILDRVADLKRPVRTAGNFVSRNGMPIFGESIVMPFGEDGEVTHLLADLDYDRAD